MVWLDGPCVAQRSTKFTLARPVFDHERPPKRADPKSRPVSHPFSGRFEQRLKLNNGAVLDSGNQMAVKIHGDLDVLVPEA